jgi:hypothetical protein
MESSHAYFDRLCVMAAVNETSPEENERLAEHARTCAACRLAIGQYEQIAAQVYAEASLEAGAGFGDAAEEQERAKAALLTQVIGTVNLPLTGDEAWQSMRRNGRVLAGTGLRMPAWAGWAAAAVLLVAVGGESSQYWLTRKHSRDVDARTVSLQNEIEGLRAELGKVRMASQSAGTKPEPVLESDDTKRLLAENESLRRSIKSSERERDHDVTELAQVQERVRLLQSSLDVLDVLQTSGTSLEADRDAMSDKVSNLTAELRRTREELAVVNTRNEQLSQEALVKVRFAERQQKLLATDHDIRDILGARSLRMIDVYDVGAEGEYEPPFGRIFYAEGRWLVFYAFDLDQQKGLKRGAIFQAWGQKGEGRDKDTPHSLGTFYIDDPIQDRWVLKVDDAKVLSRIDYVFVTDGAKKEGVHPKGRQLLSTSLNVVSNHP